MTLDGNRVAKAMATVDRRGFLRSSERAHATRDAPLPIGEGGTNSQPTTVANMLQLLDVRPGQRVLDVGAGSGWTTAILSELTGPDGEVIGIELVPALVTFGAANLSRYGATNASIHEARPNQLGWPADAPYDRILVSAMADGLPTELLDQLAPDGVMVIPVDGKMLRIHRGTDNAAPEVTEHGAYRFVPLVRR